MLVSTAGSVSGTLMNTCSVGPAASLGLSPCEAQSALPCKLLREKSWEAVSLHPLRPNNTGRSAEQVKQGFISPRAACCRGQLFWLRPQLTAEHPEKGGLLNNGDAFLTRGKCYPAQPFQLKARPWSTELLCGPWSCSKHQCHGHHWPSLLGLLLFFQCRCVRAP